MRKRQHERPVRLIWTSESESNRKLDSQINQRKHSTLKLTESESNVVGPSSDPPYLHDSTSFGRHLLHALRGPEGPPKNTNGGLPPMPRLSESFASNYTYLLRLYNVLAFAGVLGSKNRATTCSQIVEEITMSIR